jgi:hypothetical protein
MRPNDTREDIPTSGFRRLFIKGSTQQGREVTAVAYRNNGHVTLGLTTKFGGPTWDMVLQNPQDLHNVRDSEWKLTSIIATALVDFTEENKYQLREVLSSLAVDYITTAQNSPEWFLMRSFSITSSTADTVLQELYNDFKIRKLHASIIHSANAVFSVIYKNFQQIELNDDSDDDNAESVTSFSSTDSSDSTQDEREFDIYNINQNMLSWNDGGSIDAMINALEDASSISTTTLVEYVSRMGGNIKARNNCLDAIKEWLRSSVLKRPLLFLTKTQLISLLVEKKGGTASSYMKFGKPELINKLIDNENAANSEDPKSKDLWQRLVGCVIKSTCLPKLTGKGKEYSKVGHKNEEPLLKALLTSSDNPYELIQIVRPGLVSKQNYPYVKTSIDAIGFIANDEGDLEMVGIEVKSRVTNATYQAEVNARIEMSDDQIYEEIDMEREQRYVGMFIRFNYRLCF